MDEPRQTPQPSLLKRLWPILRWFIALGIIAYLIYHNFYDNPENQKELAELRERSIRWPFLISAFLLALASIIVTFIRWWLLVWAQDFPFRVWDAIRLSFISFMFNYVSPGSTGGDIIKAILLARSQTSRRAVAVLTVFLDRIIGLLALLVVGALTSLIPTAVLENREFQTTALPLYWGASIAGLIGVVLMMIPGLYRSRWITWPTRLPVVGHLFAELINSVALYQTRPWTMVLAMGLSLIGHLGMLSSFYLCALALFPADAVPSYAAHLQIIPAAELVGVLIPTPGGVGVLEGAVSHYYVVAGYAGADGLLMAFAYRFCLILIAILGGVYYLTSKQEITAAIADSDVAASAATAAEPSTVADAPESPPSA